MPYFLLDGVSIYWQINLAKFHLLVFSNNPEAHYALNNLSHRITNEFGHKLDLHIIPLSQAVIDSFGSVEPFKVLLRPDNHIGLISSNLALDEVQDYFRRHLGK